jgi:DNA helicase II / ATP-dependent DNA helicase PcrA
VTINPNCPKRAAIVACMTHALVLGGPGSGKTTVALRKAVASIKHGLSPGQTVLFLSFSRAAVTRVLDAAKLEVSTQDVKMLSVETFHSFFWRLLRPHGYLLGAPRKLSILLPQDEKALREGIDEEDEGWLEWLAAREKLFWQEGRVAFDLFAPTAAALLERCEHLPRLVGAAHPLIVVDEAQDTGTHAWRCMELLAPHAQILCLADLDQQIYDFLPGVGPERVAEIRKALKPFEVDLGSDNGRSPDSEILTFANDVLTARPRGAPYKGVQVIRYKPGKGLNWNVLLRRGIKAIFDAAKEHGREAPKTIAVLTDTGGNALGASKALSALGESNAGKSVPHKLHFDEAEALLTARMVAFLLEPKIEAEQDADVATCMALMVDAKKATGTGKKEVATLLKQSFELRAGKITKAGIVAALRQALAKLREQGFSGDPAADWSSVKRALRDTGHKDLLRAAQQLDYLVAFKRGHRISASLSEEWLRDGNYTRARAALDLALAQEQILDGTEAPAGVHVMNVHKAKGKQFDGVILVRQARFSGPKPESSFVWRGDSAPYPSSRKIVRVGASRARDYLILLDPIWPNCPLLVGHKLG